MRVWDIHGEGGELCAFEIPNTLVGRSTVVRLLKRVPGVEITKHPKFFSGNDDDFIHFTYGGEEFSVIEPFGDNSRYLVAPERSEGRSHIPEVREWFKQFRKWAII